MIEEDERGAIQALADLIDTAADRIEAGLESEFRRQPIQTVAFLAQLAVQTRLLGARGPTWWRTARDARFPDRHSTPIEDLYQGHVIGVACELAGLLAGPYEVYFDTNELDEQDLIHSKLPPSARLNDLLIGGDGEGNRAQIRVVKVAASKADGPSLRGRFERSTWKDAPGSDTWCETCDRLGKTYPELLPP